MNCKHDTLQTCSSITLVDLLKEIGRINLEIITINFENIRNEEIVFYRKTEIFPKFSQTFYEKVSICISYKSAEDHKFKMTGESVDL